MQLSKSERFLKEYTDFKNRINEISDESIKKELQSLLSQLYNSVQAIDRQHENLFVRAESRLSLDAGHNSISQLRKTLSQKISNYEKSKS